MFIIFLTFADKSKAPDHMAGHKQWIEAGLKAGTFLMVGSLKPARGGCVLARSESYEAIKALVDQDPFVVHGVVHAEIHEVGVNQVGDEMAFLK